MVLFSSRSHTSASDIDPQQEEMKDAEPASLFNQLPIEFIEITADLIESTMTRAKTEEYRTQLMEKRTIPVDEETS